MSRHAPQTEDFADALSTALRDRRVTLATLRQLLAEQGRSVSVATLSYWQTGRSLPARAGSLETVQAIEQVLELPTNTLVAALHHAQSPAWSPTSVMPTEGGPEAVLDRWGLSFDQPLSSMVLNDMLHTGGQDGIDRQDVRQLVRAHVDGVDRMPGVFYASHRGVPTVEAVNGVELGRVVELPQHKAIVVEFLFGEPLQAGEMHWMDYRVSWQAVSEGINAHGRSTRGARFLTIGASFEGDRPERARLCHRGVEEDLTGVLVEWEPVPAHVQFTVRNAPPGMYELEWYHPDKGPITSPW